MIGQDIGQALVDVDDLTVRLTVNFDQFGDTGGDVESNKNINDGYQKVCKQ